LIRLFGRRAAPSEYGAAYLEHNIPGRLPAKTILGARIVLENTGQKDWTLHHPEGKRVDLVVLCDSEVWATHHLPRAVVHPGERVTMHFPLRVPARAGHYSLKLDLVEQGVTRFEDQGVRPLTLTLHVDAATAARSVDLYEEAARTTPWHYQPARGIQQSADGRTYPLFIERARGCHVWDPEGRQYIDYVMGWGSALLGYNEPRVQRAIVDAMSCAPVVPLPHPLEVEVTHMLVEDIPCAEMAIFGKNGSDACVVAARCARVFTGRPVILFSGYHGWGDWWVEHAGFAATGVPERPRPLVHRFRFNDLADFTRLYDTHRHELAAVMLEPAGPAESPGGRMQDADRDFLTAVATMTREAGALLIYDEIMTGFRYPGGSAQKATGVIPDLACFGKALGGGMPLSAFVGRAHILQRAMEHTHYGPTYRGEVYSLAAARAAIEIYRQEPVAEHVWQFGNRLRDGVNAVCAELGVAAALTGPPFRMGLFFDDADPHRFSLKRSLYQQELLKSGLITYDGMMLPSFAHDDAVLSVTLAAVRTALSVVAQADRDGDLDRHLELPPL
jgi:glutamate-1-semialdehyde aminotransferase